MNIEKILKDINRHSYKHGMVVYGPWFDRTRMLFHVHEYQKDNGSGENNVIWQYNTMRAIIMDWMAVEPQDMKLLPENKHPSINKYEQWENEKYVVSLKIIIEMHGTYMYHCSIIEK